VYISQGPGQAFLVHIERLRIYNSISVDMIEDPIGNYQNNTCFCSFQTIWLLFFNFLTLQDKHNIITSRTSDDPMFSLKMGCHVAGIAGLVARIIHTYFTCGFIFVRSFCSIYVDNFKSQVFPM
jgi:succinate-acetate transporter protein